MRSVWILLLLPTLFALDFGSDTRAAATECDAVELQRFDLTPNDITYNRLVCNGLRELAQDRPRSAADLFREALDLWFLDRPNFDLLSRYALALHRSGEREAARRALRVAALTLEVYLGVSRCEETEDDVALVIPKRRAVEPQVREAARGIMCGAAFNSYLGGADLDHLYRSHDLLELHYQIKREIEQE
jgi:hypothetical protein